MVVVEVADAEFANLPRLVFHELADQAHRFAGVPAAADLGLECGPDGAWNRQQAAGLPLLVQLVDRCRLDVDLGVVPEGLELGTRAQMHAKTLTLGVPVARVVPSNSEAEPLVEGHRSVEVAPREDGC